MEIKIACSVLCAFLQLALGKKLQFNSTMCSRVSSALPVIVGGIKASPGEFSYMYALGWPVDAEHSDYVFKCGATMIHQRYLLTAAHCLYDEDGSPVIVRSSISKTGNGILYFIIEQIMEHPEYVYPWAYNDIAIIRISENSQKDLAYLPTFDAVYDENLTIIGYGSEKFAGLASKELLKADVKVINNTECNKFFDPDFVTSLKSEGIVETQLCAADPEKQKDTCQGDSGGPLVRKLLGLDYIIGITSFGIGCGNGPPGVYTRISAYIPWIQRIVQTWTNEESAYLYILRWKSNKTCRMLPQECPATQISWNFLVIGAHCLYERDAVPRLYRVHGLLTVETHLSLYDVYVHDNYEHPYPYDDIALIRTQFFSYVVTPIWQHYNLNNLTLTAINVYNSTLDEKKSQNLLKTTLNVVSNEECAIYYKKFPENFTKGIVRSQLCAVDKIQNWSLRQGYANGPLIMHIQEYNISNPYLVGLFSVGENCEHCPPAVFTRLSEYWDWISGIVWPNMTQWEMTDSKN